MPRWFDLKLDRRKAILLKKAVGAMAQVAFTDRELAGRPQTADLCITPEIVALVSKTKSTDAVSALMMPELLMSSFECYESRNLQFNLHSLLCLLEQNTEFAVTLYGEVEDEDVIWYELEEGFRTIYTSTMRLVSWTKDEMDLGFLVYKYPVRLGLSSKSFCDLITDMGSHGCTVHATLFKNAVVFRVVNYELVFPTEPLICETQSDRGFPCVLKFDIQRKSALLNAATLSEMIWIWFSDSFTMLNFPIRGLGKLVFGHHNFMVTN
ncbi:uncharacterized protein LOC133713611 [Rosa rugosa]|uniref:uncharacterized protein LOC133713611 n=1 Tax=Rosa rugosa TaxID=74645 RepID=UPI002B40D3D1|nr:uncharacterized protein LOC133713611 [Rosa rugosa]